MLLAQISRQAQARSESYPEESVVFLKLSVTEGLSEGQKVAHPAELTTPTATSTNAAPPVVTAPFKPSGIGPENSNRAGRIFRPNLASVAQSGGFKSWKENSRLGSPKWLFQHECRC